MDVDAVNVGAWGAPFKPTGVKRLKTKVCAVALGPEAR